MESDPAPNKIKQLNVVYSLDDGHRVTASAAEGKDIQMLAQPRRRRGKVNH
jgi:hypothetical protein